MTRSRGVGRWPAEYVRNSEQSCAEEDCEKVVRCRGLCKWHYQKSLLARKPKVQKPRKPMGPAPLPPIDRFLQKLRWADDQWFVDGVVRTRCLIWTSHKIKGYGRFRPGGKDVPQVPAHRWLYERWVGPVPDGLVLDHLCHNADPTCNRGSSCPHRACVNPAHLDPTDHGTNVRRGRGPSAVRARATHCQNGHEWTEANTYFRPTGGRSCRACARDVSKRTSGRRRVNGGLKILPKKSHCSNGHPLIETNLYFGSDGVWECRTCRAERSRRSKERLKAIKRGPS